MRWQTIYNQLEKDFGWTWVDYNGYPSQYGKGFAYLKSPTRPIVLKEGAIWTFDTYMRWCMKLPSIKTHVGTITLDKSTKLLTYWLDNIAILALDIS